MNSSTSGGGAEKKYSAKVQTKANASASCSFCSFVLTVYPNLKGMTPRDDATFKEHLKTAHGLKQDILP